LLIHTAKNPLQPWISFYGRASLATIDIILRARRVLINNKARQSPQPSTAQKKNTNSTTTSKKTNKPDSYPETTNGAKATCSLVFFKIRKQQFKVSEKIWRKVLDIGNDVFYKYSKPQSKIFSMLGYKMTKSNYLGRFEKLLFQIYNSVNSALSII
jgi:hypothetical protein